MYILLTQRESLFGCDIETFFNCCITLEKYFETSELEKSYH